MSESRHLARLTWQQIHDLAKDPGVVILPIGAMEQHGPHLPVQTDALIVTAVAEAALRLLPDDVAAWLLPELNYGKSNEHTGFPGTVSLSAATLTAILHDIADSIAGAGFRRLAFINGHGGNVAILDAAARDIRAATDLLCFCIHPAYYVQPPFAISPEEERFGFHAGELETSLLLHIAPDLVHMDRAVRHIPHYPETGTALFFFGGLSSAWLSRDWSESGVFGDATQGTAEKGAALLEVAAKRVAGAITAISTFTLSA